MTCNRVRKCVFCSAKINPLGPSMYVCNCNGIREREVRAAIDAGAQRPAAIFKACDSSPQCARCVCDMRRMLDETRETLRFAAE